MPRRPTPNPREFRALEDAAATELAAGCREVEALSFAERREIVATLRRIKANTEAAERSRAVREDLAISPAITEADLARAWTAADPPAEPAEEPPCT